MGRLHKIKGYDNLIKSFALLLAEKPNSKLLIAGSGWIHINMNLLV